jgi:3-dehydroquinate synthase
MVKIESKDSIIEIGSLLSSSLSEVLSEYKNHNVIVVVDNNTHDACLEYLITSFPGLEKAEIILLPNGEENKVMEVCMQVWNAFTEYGFGRRDLVLNLGGGVVTDMGGFIASIFKRGMNFIHIPTSLLGMVDAAVGGKNGIDLGPYKNQLGSIKKPRNVFIDTAFLSTLPEQEFYNGYAEMLKYGLIHDNSLYNDLKKYSTEKDFNRLENIEKCIQIKVEISEKDLQDVGERMLLNFGHTFGHAIEGYLLESSPISHGHAVGIGMCAESYISMQRGMLLKEDFDDIQVMLLRTYPFIEFDESEIDGILELMYNDKKNEDGKILSVLLTSIGSASFHNEIMEDEIRLALRYVSMLSASSN